MSRKHWQKGKWRRGTFQEMSELLNKDGQDTAGLTAGKANMELPPEPEKGKAPGSIRSSAEAYRNMNRSLGTVYTQNENQPNADLLRRIEDLEKKGSRRKNRRKARPWKKDGSAGKVLRAGCPLQWERAGCFLYNKCPKQPERTDGCPACKTGTEPDGVITGPACRQ